MSCPPEVWKSQVVFSDMILAGLIGIVAPNSYSRATVQPEYCWLSRTGNVHSTVVPAVPVVVSEAIGVLDTPFSASAAPLNICVVVLALIVQVADVVIGSAFI
jgi:hypothetical protein